MHTCMEYRMRAQYYHVNKGKCYFCPPLSPPQINTHVCTHTYTRVCTLASLQVSAPSLTCLSEATMSEATMTHTPPTGKASSQPCWRENGPSCKHTAHYLNVAQPVYAIPIANEKVIPLWLWVVVCYGTSGATCRYVAMRNRACTVINSVYVYDLHRDASLMR